MNTLLMNFFFFKSLWIHNIILRIHLSSEFIINAFFISQIIIDQIFSQIDNEFSIENSLWIHNLFYTESLWIHYQVNSLQIHYNFRKFTMNSLSVLRIPFALANSKNSQPREFHTHYLFREFLIDTVLYSRSHCEFTISYMH